MSAGARNVEPEQVPSNPASLWGEAVAALLAIGLGVQQLLKRIRPKASSSNGTATDWRALADAMDRNTDAIGKLIESNREEHQKTRDDLRLVNENTRERISSMLGAFQALLVAVSTKMDVLMRARE
jgi:hypothetical protein